MPASPDVDVALHRLPEHRQVAGGVADEAVDEQHPHVEHEEVGGDGEDPARLLHAPQVAVHHDGDEPEGDGDAEGAQRVEGGDERRGAGRHRDRHGEDVADEQGCTRDLRGHDAEVVARDEVGATGRRVGLDRLAVRQDQQRQHHQQGPGDRHDEREGGQADGGHEDVEDLLRGVGARRQVVGREHRQRGGLAEALLLELVAVQRRAEQLALESVAHRVGGHRDVGARHDRLRGFVGAGADRRIGLHLDACLVSPSAASLRAGRSPPRR